MKPIALAALLLFSALECLGSAMPISDAEKAACEIVADHLARGPAAIADRISSTSPFSGLQRNALLGEIEARVGPNKGAWWELRTPPEKFGEHGAVFHVVFPSGIDDVILFELRREGEAWKVQTIRTLAEISEAEREQAPPPALPSADESRFGQRLLYLIFVAPILAIVGALMRRRFPILSAIPLIGALLLFLVPVALVIEPRLFVRLKSAAVNPLHPTQHLAFAEMRGLRSLRLAIALGRELPTRVVGGEETQEIATLWIAGATVDPNVRGRMKERLRSLKLLQNAPMARLLRARDAALSGRANDAEREFTELRKNGPYYDAFWFEARMLSPHYSNVLDASNSRDSLYSYTRTMEAIVTEHSKDARDAFLEAWRLQPISRATIISAGIFAPLLQDPAISVLVNLNTPEEEKRADISLRASPMRVPAKTESRATGNYVRLTIGESRLDIPGGATIAPASTVIVAANELEHEESQAALRRASELTSRNLASAATQRIIEAAADVLADHNRWDQILDLTAAIQPESTYIPASLVTWRVRALVRAKRYDDAVRLANGPALMNAMRHTPDPGALIEIANLLAEGGAWDSAMEMLKKAGSITNQAGILPQIRRMELRRELASSPPTATTAHFQIHSTGEIPVTVPLRIGDILEPELKRLSERFHLNDFKPVQVNVVLWSDFKGQLTGSDHIVGFYDGEVTVPFGQVTTFREDVVAILTHELTHAVVAQASNDRAPRWFQEGVARRMELLEVQDNIFDVQWGKPILALDLLDPTMNSSLDPQAVDDSYVIAQTFIHFIEQRYGPESVNRLIDAFRQGADSDEAMTALTGKNMATIDAEFRDWGLTHQEAFIDRSPWPYRQFLSLGIDPKIRNAIHFTRPGAEERMRKRRP